MIKLDCFAMLRNVSRDVVSSEYLSIWLKVFPRAWMGGVVHFGEVLNDLLG